MNPNHPAPIAADLAQPRWRDDLLREYADLGQKLAQTLPCMEWQMQLPWIDAIVQLKKQRGATILAHSYQTPEIFHGVADVTGDSLALAQVAATCESDLIVLCGVHFMAESAKILAPHKTVLIPDPQAGCSLASSITAADVLALRAAHPGVPVVSYVNTSAAVKAESDACCTSANAVQVVEAVAAEFAADAVIFLPDRFLGSWVATQTDVKLILWHGQCEVHEKFTAQQARHTRERFDAKIVAHPECPPEVLAEADFVGSTSAMGKWLAREKPQRVAMITECSMADNLREQFPQVQFIKPCNLCPHMKKITLPNIHAALLHRQFAVEVAPEVAARARRALQRMLAVGRREAA
ncbi:MAG: quinolinate synthase NadA [Proteobacteria bacterium]|nr:quinolinate synthase NadA [Pseudomonadota bacterium]